MHRDQTRDDEQWLRESTADRSAIVLHVRTKSGWCDWKSRLLAEEDGLLKIACPREIQNDRNAIEAGQTIGVTLRKGHRKVLFDSEFVGRDGRTGHLIVRKPLDVQQIQRRTYARARVPDQMTIPVNLARMEAGGSVEAHAMPRRGILLDLSAGGMSVAVPPDTRNKWRPGDMMRCLLPLGPDQEPRELTARVRGVERTQRGHLRMGMQFVGLEASAEGRATLKVIARATSRFRNTAGRSA